VPAIDPELPATLSRAVLTGLLREELGFEGAVITDGIEMRAVVDRFGFEGAVIRALAAGADAICVGGDNADENTAARLRVAIAAAVAAGELAEERLVEAAKRVEHLAAWASTARAGAVPTPWYGAEGSPIGLAAARRALRVTGAESALPLESPPHVVELVAPINIAIGAETPWGIAAPLAALLPGTTSARVDQSAAANGSGPSTVVSQALGRPLVLVVRDLHRHPWMARLVREALTSRPDAVVVELGVPEFVVGDVHVATHGATRSSGLAAAELLAGRR